jgi:hypothetical protein
MIESCGLILNDEERNLISEILEEHQHMLLLEIANTDHHDFRVALQKKERLLESLLDRLAVHASEQSGQNTGQRVA